MVDVECVKAYPRLGMISVEEMLLYCKEDREICEEDLYDSSYSSYYIRSYMLENGTLVYSLYCFLNRSRICLWPDNPNPYSREDKYVAWDCSRDLAAVQRFVRQTSARLRACKHAAAAKALSRRLPRDIVVKILCAGDPP